jgi:hypothetical protein
VAVVVVAVVLMSDAVAEKDFVLAAAACEDD